MDWRHEAACKTTDPETFFPLSPAGVEAAKDICRGGCPVREQCLAYALSTGQDAGVWGGLTEEQRRELQHSRRRPRARTA